MINKYYDQDCNLGMLDGKTVAIIEIAGASSSGTSIITTLPASAASSIPKTFRPAASAFAEADDSDCFQKPDCKAHEGRRHTDVRAWLQHPLQPDSARRLSGCIHGST